MQKKVYELMIFELENLLFYLDPQESDPPNYQKLNDEHRIQNCLGISTSISELIKQIHPDNKTRFRNFKTKEYQYNLMDTISGLKIILVTSIRADEAADDILQALYQLYINYVGKNYLYQPGTVIRIKKFEEEVRLLLKRLGDK